MTAGEVCIEAIKRADKAFVDSFDTRVLELLNFETINSLKTYNLTELNCVEEYECFFEAGQKLQKIAKADSKLFNRSDTIISSFKDGSSPYDVDENGGVFIEQEGSISFTLDTNSTFFYVEFSTKMKTGLIEISSHNTTLYVKESGMFKAYFKVNTEDFIAFFVLNFKENFIGTVADLKIIEIKAIELLQQDEITIKEDFNPYLLNYKTFKKHVTNRLAPTAREIAFSWQTPNLHAASGAGGCFTIIFDAVKTPDKVTNTTDMTKLFKSKAIEELINSLTTRLKVEI